MAVVKCNWSGGKDSSCATHLHITQGDECIVCCYVPMFTDEIPLILKEHYDFILQTANKFRDMGAKVHIVHGLTYWDYVLKVSSRGKNKDKIFGFPCPNIGQCGFKRDSKEKALRELDTKFNLQYDYEDIGIAYDETKRHNQLSEKKRSILVEQKYTEPMCATHCIANGIYSPHYNRNKRDGCVLCVNGKREERIQWFNDYPKAFELLLKLQKIAMREKPSHYPLRGYKLFIEKSDQLSLFESGTRWEIN